MAGLIKNQILKHLSKFTKNLSPDKIHLSTLKGEGDLNNLELDENVLMEVLDLPTWLKLTKAFCNRVAIKIQWTKLKSQPICLFLDEIVVEMETCEEPRKPTTSSLVANLGSGGKYGFAERIIDGMYVSINSVVVNFKSSAFYSSIQLSRIIIQSKTPTWKTGDLRLTRIKEDLRGEILIFKEAEWQTLRIEANAMDHGKPNQTTTPLRLIANQSKVRITIKKRLSDCGIVASRLLVNLDDLLWVLTDSQLKAAIVFANSLKEVVKKSAQQSKQLAAEKLKKQNSSTQAPANQQASQPQRQQRTGNKSQQAITKLFDKYDVLETSYHLHTGRIDLHLCDDMATEDGSHRRKVEGGAVQVTLHKLCLDHYPFHPAGSDRTHWIHHDENMIARASWAQDLLNNFREEVRLARDTSMSSPTASPTHVPSDLSKSNVQNQSSPKKAPPRPPQPMPRTQQTKARQGTKLLESCFVVRVEDFVIYRLSTPDMKRSTPKKFLTSDKKSLLLPQDMSSIHMDYTEYYFPEGIDYPVPHANLFIVVNPIKLHLDYLTLLWANAFALNLLHTAELPKVDGPIVHIDCKIDALMPKVIVPSEGEITGQSDRPDGLQIQLSRCTLTNCNIEPKASLSELDSLLQVYENGAFFSSNNSEFPKDKEDLIVVPDTFRKYLNREDNPYLDKAVGRTIINRRALKAQEEVTPSGGHEEEKQDSPKSPAKGSSYYNLHMDSLKKDGTMDIWCILIDQFWMEFIGVPSSKNRPVPFMESFPVTVWVAQPLLSASQDSDNDKDATKKEKPYAKSDASHKMKNIYGSVDSQDSATDCDPGTETSSTCNGHLEKLCYPDPVVNNQLPSGEMEKELADLHLIVKIGAKINIEINHYQYLFLMRLIETITKHQKEIEDDTVFITEKPIPERKLSLAVTLKELELALVCPPIPEFPSLTSREDSLDLKEDDALDSGKEDCLVGSAPIGSLKDSPKDMTDSLLGTSIHSTDGNQLPGSDSTLLGTPVTVSKSYSDSDLIADGHPPQSSPGVSAPIPIVHCAKSDMQIDHIDLSGRNSPKILITDDSVSLGFSSGSPHSLFQNPTGKSKFYDSGVPDLDAGRSRFYDGMQTDGHISKDSKKKFGGAFSNLAKGIDKIGDSYSKLTEKMKQNLAKKDLLDISDEASAASDEWDSLSVKSGASSDDDEFVILGLQGPETPAFDRNRSFTDLSSVTDEAKDVESESLSSGGGRPQGLVSIVSFRVVDAEAIVQIVGRDMMVSGQIKHVIPVERGNVNLDKFQAQFAAATKVSTDTLPVVEDPPIKFRYQMGPNAEILAPGAEEKGFIHAKVSKLGATMVMSSITNLMDLIEDEIIPPIVPMLIEVQDCNFTLKDDKPPTHMTSPGMVPMDLHIGNIIVTRAAADGIFHVSGEAIPFASLPTSPITPLTPASSTTERDSSHDALVQAQQAKLDSLTFENQSLKEIINKFEKQEKEREETERENETLKKQLEKIADFNKELVEKEADQMQKEIGRMKINESTDDLVEQMTCQQEEIHMLKDERESLLATIQLLQEELATSEELRTRAMVDG